jgi:hypothetical protein
MSSFFALVTPLSVFDGSPALPGQLPVFPSLPGLPSNGLPPFAGQLPSPPGQPPVVIPPTLPGQLPVFPGSGQLPPSPWGPGLPPFPSQPWVPPTGGEVPGQLPHPGEPGSPGHLPSEPPTIVLPTGFVWAYSPRHGWLVVVVAGTPHPTPS